MDYSGGSDTFGNAAQAWADAYRLDKKIAPVIGTHCGGCQFNAPLGDTLKSGFHECWKEANDWTDEDFESDTVLSVWNYRGKQKLIDQGILKISQMTRHCL